MIRILVAYFIFLDVFFSFLLQSGINVKKFGPSSCSSSWANGSGTYSFSMLFRNCVVPTECTVGAIANSYLSGEKDHFECGCSGTTVVRTSMRTYMTKSFSERNNYFFVHSFGALCAYRSRAPQNNDQITLSRIL